jgi:hypothetical protein
MSIEWKLTFRVAGPSDAGLLGRLNFLLIRDEGHRNPMSESELAARMQEWLRSEYKAALFFSGADLVGYALWRSEGANSVYLRQFFISRDRRRRGIGRAASICLQSNCCRRVAESGSTFFARISQDSASGDHSVSMITRFRWNWNKEKDSAFRNSHSAIESSRVDGILG